jgi:hypothetical protein
LEKNRSGERWLYATKTPKGMKHGGKNACIEVINRTPDWTEWRRKCLRKQYRGNGLGRQWSCSQHWWIDTRQSLTSRKLCAYRNWSSHGHPEQRTLCLNREPLHTDVLQAQNDETKSNTEFLQPCPAAAADAPLGTGTAAVQDVLSFNEHLSRRSNHTEMSRTCSMNEGDGICYTTFWS